ncbi:MAG: ankyrin repeat domain-containing protein [Planctomycetes bacterium]|nr:ankyrin repeat domain-containing protein [Planctomycetota bacterium]
MKYKDCFLILFLVLSTATHAEDGQDLFAAAMTGKIERTEAILAQGIDVISKTISGRTALMAASFSGNVHIVKILLVYGADVNIVDNLGVTALMDAIVFGNEEVVNLLIAAGADVNALDKQGVTVLARAKKFDHKKVNKILEDAGAKEEAEVPIEEATSKDEVVGKPGDKPDTKPPGKK